LKQLLRALNSAERQQQYRICDRAYHVRDSYPERYLPSRQTQQIELRDWKLVLAPQSAVLYWKQVKNSKERQQRCRNDGPAYRAQDLNPMRPILPPWGLQFVFREPQHWQKQLHSKVLQQQCHNDDQVYHALG
jgi:hypothetical protein